MMPLFWINFCLKQTWNTLNLLNTIPIPWFQRHLKYHTNTMVSEKFERKIEQWQYKTTSPHFLINPWQENWGTQNWGQPNPFLFVFNWLKMVLFKHCFIFFLNHYQGFLFFSDQSCPFTWCLYPILCKYQTLFIANIKMLFYDKYYKI